MSTEQLSSNNQNPIVFTSIFDIRHITPPTVKTQFWPDASANPFMSAHGKHLYAEKIVDKVIADGKYNVKLKRNYTIKDRINKKGIVERFIRITKPVGSYKFFKVIPTGLDPIKPYTELDLETTFQLACNWFLEERKKCLVVITSRNLDVTKTRKNARLSLLFAGPSLERTSQTPSK